MRTDREPLTESLCGDSLLCAPGLLDGPLTGSASTEVRSVQTSWLLAEEAKVSEVKHSDYRPRLDAGDKRSDLVHWEDLEGAGEVGGGRGDRDGEHM